MGKELYLKYRNLKSKSLDIKNLELCRSKCHIHSREDVSKEWYTTSRDRIEMTYEDKRKNKFIMYICPGGYELPEYKSVDLCTYAMYTVMYGEDIDDKKVFRFNLSEIKHEDLVQKGHLVMVLLDTFKDDKKKAPIKFSMSSYGNRYKVIFSVSSSELLVVVEKKPHVPRWGNLLYDHFIWTG